MNKEDVISWFDKQSFKEQFEILDKLRNMIKASPSDNHDINAVLEKKIGRKLDLGEPLRRTCWICNKDNEWLKGSVNDRVIVCVKCGRHYHRGAGILG